jgi:sugar lactone lactonase YvrE
VELDDQPPNVAVPRWSASIASADVFGLGEGPLWDPQRRRVLWVDVDAGTVHEGTVHEGTVHEGGLDGGHVVRRRSWHLDRTVGAVVCSAAGDLLVAGARGLITVTESGSSAGPAIVTEPTRRLNDGGCDPAGNFLVGTLALDGARGSEVLVRVGRDRAVTVLDDDLTLSNGLAWSADGSLLYSVDTVPGIVWVRSYDAVSGAVGTRRLWLRIADGGPDGICMDVEGYLWIAVWGAGQVRRYGPDGQLAGIVDVPAPHTSSVAFVGDGLDQLLITTATADLGADQLAAFPDSGRLFLADVGVTGLPVTAWSGFLAEA